VKRIITVTIEVRDDDRIDESDRFDELEYWTGQALTVLGSLVGDSRQFRNDQARVADSVEWTATDLTTIDIKQADDGS